MLSSRRGGSAGVAYTGKGVACRRRRRVAGGGASLEAVARCPAGLEEAFPPRAGHERGGSPVIGRSGVWTGPPGPRVANPVSGSAPPVGLLPPKTRVLDQRADIVFPPCWFSGGRSAGPPGGTVYFVQQIFIRCLLEIGDWQG